MRNGVQCKHLLMRNDSDHNHSSALKEQQLVWLRDLYDIPWSEIEMAYDDRQEVVDMYLRNGIPAQRRCIHDVCAYTKPEKK